MVSVIKRQVLELDEAAAIQDDLGWHMEGRRSSSPAFNWLTIVRCQATNDELEVSR